MKIKNDFVTNSSSASFIMIFSAPGKTIEEFTEQLNDFIESYKKETEDQMRFWDATNITELDDGKFKIEEWTSMYNYLSDIPKYMQYIMVDKVAVNQSGLSWRGITMESFDVEEDG